MKRSGSSKKLFPKLLLILIGILIGGLISEIALRVIGYSYPEFYQLDYSRGYALRPGMEGWYRKEGASYVRINSDGLRDHEHTKTKPPQTIRIAVIGDSYPEAFQGGGELRGREHLAQHRCDGAVGPRARRAAARRRSAGTSRGTRRSASRSRRSRTTSRSSRTTSMRTCSRSGRPTER